MRKLLLYSLALLLATSCLSVQRRVDRAFHGENPYLEPPFYARYLNTGSQLDRQISDLLARLRSEPDNPALHNDLGALLLQKGFPKDAELEFRRAIQNDKKMYAAWYNLGVVREARGDESGAMDAFAETLEHKPGHPMAHFQLGLLLEKRGSNEAAVEHFARAFEINDKLLDVAVNPRILDTRLVDRALLYSYDRRHARSSAQFQATPAGYVAPVPRSRRDEDAGRTDEPSMEAPSPEPPPSNIISPAPSASDIAKQPTTGAATQPTRPDTTPAQTTRPRPRRRAELPEETPVQPTTPTQPATPVTTPGSGGPGFTLLPGATPEARP